MKLLFVHQHLGAFGGAETNIQIVASELKRRGHTLALLYKRATGRAENEWQQIFSERFCLPTCGSKEIVEAVLEHFQPNLVYLHNTSDLELLQALLDSSVPVVRMAHDHAIYCMRGYKYNFFSRKICTRAFSPFCLFPCLASIGRNREHAIPLQWVSYSAKKREIELNRRCARLIVYSDYLKQELVRNKFAPEKIEICVPIRIAQNDHQISSYSGKNLILFAGQLIRGKGVDQLLLALSKVLSPFQCVILGDGNHRTACEKLCARLGLQDRVHFQGYVLPSKLKEFYLQANIFVMSSLWPEPFGMAGPEAMRYGLPVVAFDAGGIREWLDDGRNGYVVEWGNTNSFAARIDDLLSNKELARNLGRNARQSVLRFEALKQIDHLERVLQNVVSEGPDNLSASQRTLRADNLTRTSYSPQNGSADEHLASRIRDF